MHASAGDDVVVDVVESTQGTEIFSSAVSQTVPINDVSHSFPSSQFEL